jgi:alpha-beta hydrolase superfamily lysophospholipase
MTLDKYVDDVIEWVNFIKTDTRFTKITIIGHSEGSLIGMLAAQKSQVDK